MMELTEEEAAITARKIEALKLEHRDLDEIIDKLSADPVRDELQIRRLKKRKLLLKDQLAQLESQLVPDIPA